MALLDRAAGLLVTAAPGTGSTALREAFMAQRDVVELPDLRRVRTAGLDAKHSTERELVEAGLLPAGHGLRVVTTTRNPFDFYVAEHGRSRSRWVHELRDPRSWVHATPGAVDRIVDAVTLDFGAWVAHVIGSPIPRRINRGHVEEADVVLRMESLETDLHELVGLQLTVTPTNVTSRTRSYWQSYDMRARALVQTVHAEDLDRYGYVF